LHAFRELDADGLTRLAAVADLHLDRYPDEAAELTGNGVAAFTSYEDVLDAGGFDFVVLVTPLNCHRPQTLAALDAGIPVLCEKSAAPTIQDVQAMVDAQARTGLPLDIAYPQQNASSVLAMQRALIGGRIGRVRHVVVRGAWLRDETYYQRAGWAGRARVSGDWTLDGPINNPLSHYIHAGMYFAGDQPGLAADPVRVRAELYRARPTIEGEDTACIEVEFKNGVREYVYVTLAAKDETYRNVRIDVYGDDGELTWFARSPESPLQGRRADGTHIRVEHEGIEGTTKRSIANFARVLLGESEELYSPISEALKFSRLSNGAFESSGRVYPIPGEFVERDEELVRPVRGGKDERESALVCNLPDIVPTIDRAAERRALFSDLGIPWAVATEPFDVSAYDHFPQRFVPAELPW
jgi:predicted dehydrogenase